ncbi:hypothetical protein AMAG_03355 [Allomyces macrogynus ATCC 38327]|uniref:NADPH--hemoprotein reductase n=1 Tax=Allomyces macrogynus (strain ATCC 38327) TaxID=578462 RepID=A0A0L0S8V5_ALLM3|nr:hypothetical protein AMAG_03355 [Allomyces macrogynus ATCC 38327]|eukprot:KNE59003.1 hypothetical protein AMAG_03355 [Allomyces macrogynus ATCC 38327]
MGDALLVFGCRNEQHEYVQHRLAKHGDRVWDLVHKGAHIYVCGDAKNIVRDVPRWFVEAAMTHEGLSEDQAERFVKDMRTKGRYLEDV